MPYEFAGSLQQKLHDHTENLKWALPHLIWEQRRQATQMICSAKSEGKEEDGEKEWSKGVYEGVFCWQPAAHSLSICFLFNLPVHSEKA